MDGYAAGDTRQLAITHVGSQSPRAGIGQKLLSLDPVDRGSKLAASPNPQMRGASPAGVTALIHAWTTGDETARDRLWTIVFPELDRLARAYMRRERPDHTLQTGALVNEAYVRLVDWKQAHWRNRAHFFGMCARIMRQILVDHARAQHYQKRGGAQRFESLDETATVSPT